MNVNAHLLKKRAKAKRQRIDKRLVRNFREEEKRKKQRTERQ